MATFSRRQFILGAGVSGVAIMLNRCAKESKDKEVSAVEDLMREHGVLRRILFLYSEAALRLRNRSSSVPAQELRKAATLFREFGEEYHEKKLEEAEIFPAVVQRGGEAARYIGVLAEQHQKGREITDYILTVLDGVNMSPGSVKPLISALDAFVRMYRPHAAREDTVVFPAWKEILSAKELDLMNDKFEDIEHQQFGSNGFERAVRQIGDIESALGLADLNRFTAPPPGSS